MSTITDADVLDAMMTFGGSFVQALSEAWRQADAVNRDKLRATFPDLWTQYHELVTLRRQREGAA